MYSQGHQKVEWLGRKVYMFTILKMIKKYFIKFNLLQFYCSKWSNVILSLSLVSFLHSSGSVSIGLIGSDFRMLTKFTSIRCVSPSVT